MNPSDKSRIIFQVKMDKRHVRGLDPLEFREHLLSARCEEDAVTKTRSPRPRGTNK